MVITTRLHQWCARLVDLRRSLECADDRGEAWLFRIRLKIIGYLIARYADTAIANQPVDASVDAEPQEIADIETARSGSTASLDLGCANPPKSTDDLRPILAELLETNDNRREREGVYRNLDHAWLWWRDAVTQRKRGTDL